MKQVRALSLMLLVSAISLAGFSQSKDVAKLDKKVIKKSSVKPEKKLTGGVPFVVTSNTLVGAGGCPSTIPSGATLNLNQYPVSAPPPPTTATCATQTIATCVGSKYFCVFIIHPDDIEVVDGFWVPKANARILECCDRDTEI